MFGIVQILKQVFYLEQHKGEIDELIFESDMDELTIADELIIVAAKESGTLQSPISQIVDHKTPNCIQQSEGTLELYNDYHNDFSS